MEFDFLPTGYLLVLLGLISALLAILVFRVTRPEVARAEKIVLGLLAVAILVAYFAFSPSYFHHLKLESDSLIVGTFPPRLSRTIKASEIKTLRMTHFDYQLRGKDKSSVDIWEFRIELHDGFKLRSFDGIPDNEAHDAYQALSKYLGRPPRIHRVTSPEGASHDVTGQHPYDEW